LASSGLGKETNAGHPEAKEDPMTVDMQAKVISFLQDAHAMEQSVTRMLERMIATTEDSDVRALLEDHRIETERHEQLLLKRLEALGSAPSPGKEVPAMLGAAIKGLTDMVRSDKPVRDARDGYVTEHLEIATYRTLEELADRAGDQETVNVASRIRADEEAMAEKISSSWGRAVDRALAEERDLEHTN
jgi:ferritin-like metal-binding protein YciE